MRDLVTTKKVVDCPRTGCKGHFFVDHLLKEKIKSIWNNYEWGCDCCGWMIKLTPVIKDQKITDFQTEAMRLFWKPGYSLLRYHKKDSAFFVVKTTKVYDFDGNGIFSTDKSSYYNEHTCPTNWIKGDVIKIIDDGDDDPHGVFRWVTTMLEEELIARYPDLNHMTEEHEGQNHVDNVDWLKVFEIEITLCDNA